MERLKVQSIAEEIQTNEKNWKEHVQTMQDERLQKLVLKYQPVGKRRRSRHKRKGETISWKRVEEYRINKTSQQFKINMNKKRRRKIANKGNGAITTPGRTCKITILIKPALRKQIIHVHNQTFYLSMSNISTYFSCSEQSVSNH
jgi:hypothetical protein